VRRRRKTGNYYLPRARNSDPWTSHVAGAEWEDQRIRPDSVRHKLLALFATAHDGLIGDQLPNGWWKRVSELRRFKLIRNTGVPRMGSTDRPGLIHMITEQGRHVLVWLDAGKTWPPT
jgi:hypothetical protein